MMQHTVRFALLWLLSLSSALAAGDGTAVGVAPDAVVRQGAAERTLVVGTDVSVGERVVTGPSGRVQLLFNDNTRLVVGPGSALEIETYLLNGSRNDAFAVNALAGTFRFLSGSSPKSVYSIDTPTASIAVRGTEFDVTVEGGRSEVLLFKGALTICRGSNCVDLENRCDIGVATDGTVASVSWVHPERGNYNGRFPLPNIQSSFRPDFRVSGAQACVNPKPDNSATSLVPPSGSNGNLSQQTCTYPYTGSNC